MDEKQKNKLGYLAVVLLCIIGAYSLGKEHGYEAGASEYETVLYDAKISGCESNGCDLDIPEKEESFFISCDDDYICITQPKTDEIRKRDEKLDEIWRSTLEKRPPPVE